MKENILSSQIYNLRKRMGITQDVIADELGITPQSISRWENGQSRPDVDMLPKIAAFFHVSIDSLFGHRADNLVIAAYEKNFNQHKLYWSNTIKRMDRKILKFLPPKKPLHILNIGCGEGQSAIFFARNGYIVSACDTSEKNLDIAKKSAARNGLDINFFIADIVNYEIETKFDIIYACGALQYIPQTERERVFKMFQAQTNLGGLNVISALVEKSFIKPAPDWDNNSYLYDSAEIFKYYDKNWKYNLMEETCFSCESEKFPPHEHCIDQLIATRLN